MRFFFTLVILFVFTACKKDNKDKLEGEVSFLVGKWEWQYSISNYHNYYIGVSNLTDTIYASEYEDSYQIEFLEEGRIHFYKNNQGNDWYNFVFSSLQSGNCGNISCGTAVIAFKSKKYPRLVMSFKSLTKMSTSDTNIPLKSTPYGSSIGKRYSHYYKKVE